MDGETAVSNDYKEGENKFTGKIQKIVIETGKSALSDADTRKSQEAEAASASISD
jgi:arylsulfatase